MADSSALKNLETRLNMAVDAAVQAERDLNAARAKAGLPPAEPRSHLGPPPKYSFASRGATGGRWGYFPDAVTALLACKLVAEDRGLTDDDVRDIVRITSDLSTRDQAPTAAQREAAERWADAWATKLAEARGRTWSEPAAEAAAKIIAAGKKRRGETVVELPPLGTEARKIIDAGRRRRGEI